MTKIVTPSKFQEWKGLDRISEIVHDMKCIFREIKKDDYGIDGEIEVVLPKSDRKGYEATGGILKVQSKSGESYIRNDSNTCFTTPIEKKDLEYWNNSNYPILFIVYHPKDDKLYWKEMKSYIKNALNVFQPPLKIIFQKDSDEFTNKCYEQICKIAQVSKSRINVQQKEKLYSNLLLIKYIPKFISYSSTTYKEAKQIVEKIEGFIPPFFIKEGRLYTLSNLSHEKCVLRKYCDNKNIIKLDKDGWICDEIHHRDFVFLLNILLSKHLRRCGLNYNKHFKRYYFPRENQEDLEFKRDWKNVRTGRDGLKRVVAKHYKYGKYQFWRHLASNLTIKHIGSKWFLQVIHQYLFTLDGEKPWEDESVGPYTTRIKATESNMKVLNYVLFWADILSQNSHTIKIILDFKTAMEIEKRPFSGIANFAIPYDPATYEEEVETGQIDLYDSINIVSEDLDYYEY